MSESQISRREAMKLAKLAALLAAGLGISKIVDAKTGELVPGIGQGRAKTEQKTYQQIDAYIRGKRLPPNTYITTVFKVVEGDLELLAIVPMHGDIEAAIKDPATILSIRLTGKDRRAFEAQKTEKEYSLASVNLREAKPRG